MANVRKSSKRKARQSELATDNGINSEAMPRKVLEDGAQVTHDLNELTMGEKLSGLNFEESTETKSHEVTDISSSIKPPSADSVHILLKQALRADDRSLLIDCLSRQNGKVVTNSLSLLNPSDVSKLLQSLVTIIQLRGAVLACVLPWLKSLLLQHAGSIMSQESSLAALNSLYQLIESRASTFNHALQVSSYLDLVFAETVEDGDEENDMITPFVFEDNDESDDEGSQDSMEIESIGDGEVTQAHSEISN